MLFNTFSKNTNALLIQLYHQIHGFCAGLLVIIFLPSLGLPLGVRIVGVRRCKVRLFGGEGGQHTVATFDAGPGISTTMHRVEKPWRKSSRHRVASVGSRITACTRGRDHPRVESISNWYPRRRGESERERERNGRRQGKGIERKREKKTGLTGVPGCLCARGTRLNSR